MNTKNTMKFLTELCGELTLGKLINSIRLGNEESQIAFAKRLSISRQQLCDIEHERKAISPKTAAKYAELLGYSVPQFIRLSLQSLVDKDNLNVMVDIKPRQLKKVASLVQIVKEHNRH